MSGALLLIESALVAAVLTAWCRLAATPAGQTDPAAGPILVVASLAVAAMLGARLVYSWKRRTLSGGWWGLDAAVRQLATPVAIGAAGALAAWAVWRASEGEKLGGYGSLLVLLLVTASGAKLAAETYLFAQLGGDPSPRQESARALVGPKSLVAKTRYALGVMGGIVLPLGAQILAGGAKNIPAVADAAAPATLAVLSLVCLLPGELLERRLFWSDGAANSATAARESAPNR
ncbi:hypothetical protein [Botrimarina sp.]|uniref:hypothetical protein n=1 Tax=Botrimarina sp. TaxID=2795802 RepID=UPI0032ED8BBD